ncbi:hypothetical protein D6827_01095 [Candidatus Parcubacteria bacterium]|nr:MAG: hypothetical protein D6827_01095 [Candidatus Parcubacteria bacterium]
MAQIGRLKGVGLGKETSRGTAAAPSFFLPLTDYSFDDKVEIAPREGRKAVIETTQGGDVVKTWAEGSIEGNVYSDSFGLVLLASFGSVSSAVNSDASGTVYDHTFSVVDTSNQHQSLTVSLADDEAGDKQYTNTIIDSLELKAEEGAYLMFTADLKGNSETSGSVTASYSTEYPFRPQDMAIVMADNASSLGSGTALSVKSLTLKMEKNAEPYFTLGSTSAADFYNKNLDGSIEIEMLYTDDTFRDAWKSGGTKAFQITLTNSDVTIGTSANPRLQIVAYQGQIVDWSLNQGNDDIVTQTISIRLDYSLSDAKFLEAILTNTQTSY